MKNDNFGATRWGAANNNYSCTQTAMIEQWRKMFEVPSAFYAIVQLSTWFADPQLLVNMLILYSNVWILY